MVSRCCAPGCFGGTWIKNPTGYPAFPGLGWLEMAVFSRSDQSDMPREAHGRKGSTVRVR
jgi:hypothetical protein